MKKTTKFLFALLTAVGLNVFAQVPTASFAVSPTVCLGSAITVTDQSTGGGGTIAVWAYTVTGATQTLILQQNPSITFTATGTQSISLAVVNTNSVPSTVITKTVNVLASPNVSVVSSATGALCPGSSATLTASGANSYSWAAPTSTNSTVNITPMVTTVYTVVGTGTNGCTSTRTISQNVATSPVTVTSTSSLLCVGNSATLTASGATSYTWVAIPPVLNAQRVVSPTVTTTYTLIAMGGTACPSSTWIASFTQSVTTCTGIESNSGENITLNVYPNPAKTDLVIELNNGMSKNIEVIDLTGKAVISEITSMDKHVMNVANLNAGIYFVRVQSDNSLKVLKFVKE